MRRASTVILLSLLLVGLLSTTLNIREAKASGPIYIRADGRIDPPTANITTTDNVTYTFTDNNYDSIVIEKSDIVVDGAGYALQGTGAVGSSGIDLTGRANVSVRNTQIDNFYYGIWLNTSSHVSISGNTITDNSDGIWLNASSNSTISGNLITDNYWGIMIDPSSNDNSIIGNTITANNMDGIWIRWCYGIRVNGNTITANAGGIRVTRSSGISVSGNTVAANLNEGIILHYSSNNSVSGNTVVAHNAEGIMLIHSSNNSVSGNTLIRNHWGVWLSYSSDNRFHNNNFIANDQQVRIYTYGNGNVWDDGYPGGGNYWSNYTGIDEKSGPDQDQPGSDGIGDTPYTIDPDNQDRYPLMTLPGDVDGDRDVDIFDIVLMAGGYGTSEGQPKFNADCDIDGDGDIDIFDIVIAAGHYGESW